MSNNSGVSQTIINTRTRAVSSSVNDLQFPIAEMQAQDLLRSLNDQHMVGGFYAPARSKTFSTTVNDAPLSANVFGGLKVRPFATFLLVEPGTLGAHATTASFDSATDSQYMLIDDPGVLSSAVLVFVANGTGSLRVDVVECSLLEQDTTASQDVYNTITRQFDPPQLLTVGRAVVLNYRIRQGTAGSGFPASQTGWLPLAVAIHHANSASFADVDFYDVRPMIHGRRDPGGNELRGAGFQLGNQHFYGINDTGGLTGTFDMAANIYETTFGASASVYGGPYRALGRFNRTLPAAGQTAETLDLPTANASNPYYTATTGAALADRWMYVLSIEPFGLPRWSKYSTAVSPLTGEREPSDNWGLYVIADRAGIGSFAVPGNLVTVTIPAGYGLGTSQPIAQIVALYRQNGLASALSSLMRRDGLVYTSYPSGMLIVAGTGDTGTSPNTTTYALGSPPSNTGVPMYVSGIRVLVEFDVAPGIQVEQCHVDIVLKGGATVISPVFRQSYGFLGNSFTVRLSSVVDFIVPIGGVNSPGTSSLSVEATCTMTGAGAVSFNLFNSQLTLQGFWIGI